MAQREERPITALPRPEEEPKRVTNHGIRIRAANVEQDSLNRGIFTIYVPAREINTNEGAVLEVLFPNTRIMIDKLLSIEALMKAIQ